MKVAAIVADVRARQRRPWQGRPLAARVIRAVSGGIIAADAALRRTILPNGLTVLSEHMPGVRSVSFGAWVRAASLHEPRERMGVSHLLEHMVFKGTARRSAHEIALSLEALGGSLDAYTSREHTVYQGRVLDEHLSDAADVIADIVFRPTLRESDLLLERKVILEEIGMVEDTPDDLVFELHNEALWGEHPYGYSILGTRDTVNGLGVGDLRDAARTRVPSWAARRRRGGKRGARTAARRARGDGLDGRRRGRRHADDEHACLAPRLR